MSLTQHSIRNTQYDLLIIGGGITGAVLANLASKKGYSVCLLEQNAFCSGTSSKSTKLVHGGIRYLEQFEFSLVREALIERDFWLKTAPEIVEPIDFIIPIYKNSPRPTWMMHLGVKLYDLCSYPYQIKSSQSLSLKQLKKENPLLNTDGLKGAVKYSDARMDDYALCLSNIKQAQAQGTHAIEHVKVLNPIKENSKVIGVTTNEGDFFAKHVVAATGPWTNNTYQFLEGESKELLRTTKGVHLIYQQRFSNDAILLQSKDDNRIFFVIPWDNEASLIGTTDTDYKGDLNNVQVDNEDINYLLSRMKEVFPTVEISPIHIRYSFAGLRPLVFKEGNPSELSRKHRIVKSQSDVTYVFGGKYTTSRIMARDALIFLGLLGKGDDISIEVAHQ